MRAGLEHRRRHKKFRHHLLPGPSALLLVAMLPLTGSAQDQESPGRHSLETVARSGQVIVVEGRISLNLALRMEVLRPAEGGGRDPGTSPGPLIHDTRASYGSRLRFSERTLEVRSGLPVTARRRYLEFRDLRRDPGAPRVEETTHPMEGREVMLRRRENGRVSAVALDPSAAKAVGLLGRALVIGERFGLALPQHPVAPGDSWEISGERLQRCLGEGLGGEGSGRMVATFEGVQTVPTEDEAKAEPEGGNGNTQASRSLARIALTLELDSPLGEGGPRIKAELKGVLLFDLDRHQIDSVTLEGDARFENRTTEPTGATIEVVGRGPLKLHKQVRDAKPGEEPGGKGR